MCAMYTKIIVTRTHDLSISIIVQKDKNRKRPLRCHHVIQTELHGKAKKQDFKSVNKWEDVWRQSVHIKPENNFCTKHKRGLLWRGLVYAAHGYTHAYAAVITKRGIMYLITGLSQRHFT